MEKLKLGGFPPLTKVDTTLEKQTLKPQLFSKNNKKKLDKKLDKKLKQQPLKPQLFSQNNNINIRDILIQKTSIIKNTESEELIEVNNI